jgi:translation elongation factor EF-Tu-like GTPase
MIGVASTDPTVPAPFFMPVTDIVRVPERGILLVGDILRGEIAAGDRVDVYGYRGRQRLVITMVEPAHGPPGSARDGEQVGLFVAGLRQRAVSLGEVVAAPDSVQSWRRCTATLQMRATADGGRAGPFRAGYAPLFVLWRGVTGCWIELSDSACEVELGHTTAVTLTLRPPRVVECGTAFTLQEGGRVIADGVVDALLEAAALPELAPQ